MTFKETLVFVAGTTPQIITETIYALSQKTNPVYPDELFIIITSTGRRKIEDTLLKQGVLKSLVKEYSLPEIRLTEDSFIIVRDETGREIDDIKDESENEVMGDLITSLIQRLTADKGTRLHCSLAGGRKTMSFYLGAALQLFGRPWDKLYHVLVTPEFETNPAFFYKPKKNRMIECRLPGGVTKRLNIRDAEIYLTDLPFIRLGNRLSLHGKSFTDLVAEGQREIDMAVIQPDVRVDLTRGEVNIGNILIRIPPVQIIIYMAFLRQKLEDCKQPDRQYCAECTDCFKPLLHLKRHFIKAMSEDYGRLYGNSSAKAGEWRDKWSGDPAFDGMIRQNMSKINKAIRNNIADSALLPYYIIAVSKKYGDTRYGIRVDKGKIKIV